RSRRSVCHATGKATRCLPVPLPYVTASAVLKAFVFSCRGHAAVPISSGLGWLLMSGSISGLRRAGTRGNRAGSEGSSVFWEVFCGRSSADWCFVVRQWLGGASRPDLADCPPVIVARAKGSRGVHSPVTRDAHRRCPSIPEKSRALMVRDGRFVSLETRLGSGS